MRTKTLSIATAIMALFFIGTSCSNKQKSTEETATTEQTSGAMEIDDLLANAESLTDQEVTIEGVCTHACKHGATKIFLMGSDDTQTIRVEAAKLWKERMPNYYYEEYRIRKNVWTKLICNNGNHA